MGDARMYQGCLQGLRLPKQAVIDFQDRHDLVADGIVGPETRAKIVQLHGI